jgi:predicted transcriptional regulator
MRAKDPNIISDINEDIAYIDETEALEGIRRGLADVEAGRVTPLEEFEKEFRKRHGIPWRSTDSVA